MNGKITGTLALFGLLILASLTAAAGETDEKETPICHVSLVEITPAGFTHLPAAVANYQSETAKGGECAEEMKNHVKEFARNCHEPNKVLAEIHYQAERDKAVDAELAMDCTAGSTRKPASAELDHVNRYINEAYNQLQTNYDRHPLTNVPLRAPRSSPTRVDVARPSTHTDGVLYGGENVHAHKRQWLEDPSTTSSASDPDRVVETRLRDRGIAATENQNQTAEENAYIQEFIKNAKADGWSVRVKNGTILVAPRARFQ